MSVACKECGTIYDNLKEVRGCLEEHQFAAFGYQRQWVLVQADAPAKG